MKIQVSLGSFFGMLAAAAPLSARDSISDAYNGMSDIVAGDASCAPVAVIFARGTFDSGNVGVWVGPQFFESLKSSINGVALQGVDPDDYPANLDDYLAEKGGSDAGATSMAKAVVDYASKCPASIIILSGWSQGAVVSHKALKILNADSGDVMKQIGGLVTFGDPNHVWESLPLPDSIPASSFSSYCITGTIFDPLCADLPEDFKLPTSADDITGPFSKLPDLAVGIEQVHAAADIVADFPGQISKSFTAFLKQLLTKAVRLLLTPEHFTYGNNGMAATGAGFVADLPAVKTALAKRTLSGVAVSLDSLAKQQSGFTRSV